MMFCNFLEVCKDVTNTAKKIPQNKYLSCGKYKIFDQGKNYIGGFYNLDEGLSIDYPYIIFGDHTRVVKYVDEPCYIGADGVKLLKVYNDNFIIKYVYYAMLANPVENLGYSRHFKLLKDIKIRKVDKTTQIKIVNDLDKIKYAISLKTIIHTTFDELVKSRFIEMFGDPILNEKNWKVMIWNDVLIIKNGRNHKSVENPEGIYPICGSGGIMGYANDYITKENSIIIGRKGSINKPILMKTKYWNVDTAFGIEPNEDIVNSYYLFMFCVFFNFEWLNKAVTIPSLTKSDLLKINMPVPPIELQNEFAEFVKLIDKSKYVC